MKAKIGGTLYRVTAPNFTALYQLTNDNRKVWWAAPLLAHMECWATDRAWEYCWGKGWTLHRCEGAFEKGKWLEWWTEEVRPTETSKKIDG